MPTYEYECKICQERFETFQSITAEPLKACPKCSGEVRRLIGSGSGIIFKGPGFYATDYKKSGKSVKSCPAADPKKRECRGCPKVSGE